MLFTMFFVVSVSTFGSECRAPSLSSDDAPDPNPQSTTQSPGPPKWLHGTRYNMYIVQGLIKG